MQEAEAATFAGADGALMVGAVRDAGRLALSFFGKGPRQWTKDDGSPVSEADLAVNDLLRKRLRGERPGYGWLSEETEDDDSRLGRSRVWVVDPIDGTRSFLKGVPHWTVSVALIEDGIPVIGCVFNPAENELFTASRGAGARLNGREIRVSRRNSIGGCRMMGHAFVFDRKRWRDPWPEMETGVRNSMAYRLCLVASGDWDATFTILYKADWDLAAADLIVNEAGGRVSMHDGGMLVYNRPAPRHPTVLAAGPELHGSLVARTRSFPEK